VNIENLGQPNLSVLGLSIWIHSREYENLSDYLDGNWLTVTIHCTAEGAKVTTHGSIMRVTEINDFYNQLIELDKSLTGAAEINCIEPNFALKVSSHGSLGELQMDIRISPNHLTQEHSFTFKIDQSFLKKLLSQCKDILNKYPVVGQMGKK